MIKYLSEVWASIGKTGKRITLIATIIGSASVISPFVSKTYRNAQVLWRFLSQGPDKLQEITYTLDKHEEFLERGPIIIDSQGVLIKNLLRYQIETSGVLMSNMDRFDPSKLSDVLSGTKLEFVNERSYRVKINGEYVEAELGVTRRGMSSCMW